jgi:predicted nicotinamide N-methyase
MSALPKSAKSPSGIVSAIEKLGGAGSKVAAELQAWLERNVNRNCQSLEAYMQDREHVGAVIQVAYVLFVRLWRDHEVSSEQLQRFRLKLRAMVASS